MRKKQGKEAKLRHKAANTIKTIQMKPSTDEHDRGVKIARAESFLEKGYTVRIVMILPGRWRFGEQVKNARNTLEQVLNTLDEFGTSKGIEWVPETKSLSVTVRPRRR
jgi:translation initiation factor IF-3